MKSTTILLALLTALGGLALAAGPASAGDIKAATPIWHYSARGHALPFPRSERAQAVWASGACWSECGSYCAWGLAGCLQVDPQGRCLKLADTCDRYCQRECRTQAGPLFPIDF
jgi:hypothetical protein